MAWRGTAVIEDSVSVRNAVCCELLRWGFTYQFIHSDCLNMPSWHGEVQLLYRIVLVLGMQYVAN